MTSTLFKKETKSGGSNSFTTTHHRFRLLPALLLLCFLLPLAGCAGLDPFNKEESPQNRFIDKITGAVWYQEFRNAHTRVPRITFESAPGFKTEKLIKAMKKHPTVLTLSKSAPDFTLRIRPDSQAELLDTSKNIVWLVGTNGAVGETPVAKPVILWRGFYGGPRAGLAMGSGGVFQGSSATPGGGLRMGYSFTNLGDISAYMPQLTFDWIGSPTIKTSLAGSSSTLSGTVGVADVMVDPLRFGFPLFSGSTLLSVALGAGNVMLSEGLSSNVNPEGHFSIGLEYRLFEHWAPYVEFIAEEVFLSGSTTANYTSGPETYSTQISQFGSTSSTFLRFMVGVDWFPWITKSSVTSENSP